MKVDMPMRNYRMIDAMFIAFMDNICMQLRSDIEILTEYGVNDEKIKYVEQLCHRIKYFPDDNRIKYHIVGKTEELKAASTALIDEIRMIIVRAKACFGDKSAFVKNLGMSNVGNLSYDKLISSSKAMIPALEAALPQLADYGFTIDTINSLSDKIKAVEDAWQSRKNMMDERVNTTIERINLSNELYEKVAMYAEIAKAVFVKSNPVRYKQYLLSKGRKRSADEEIGTNESSPAEN